jgi:ABC-type phosphate transport system substrate-binding protein
MRMLSKVIVGAAAVAASIAMAAGPALADPPAGTTPKPTDVVGVGSDTIQNVMDQFSHDYNASHTGVKLYSWDATNPSTGAIGDNITYKSGCTVEPRPDGSSAGIAALATNNGGNTHGSHCIDFARSSRDRSATDPAFAAGGIAFDSLAGDAVTYATQPGSHAPANLSTAQLRSIYTCKVTNWSQVGGKAGKIAAFIPQAGSGTRNFFLAALGITGNPGSCVSDVNATLQENEGVNPALNKNKANVVFPFSIGKWIAEKFHSAKCFNTACTAATSGPNKGKVCKPSGKQNLFGCDTHGTMVLNSLNHTKPTTGTGSGTKINPAFSPTFTRTLFEVVRFSTAAGNVNHIPPSLVKFFGPKGFVCTSKVAQQDLLNYGFIVLRTCGATH